MLDDEGWSLSPAYDMNPDPAATGLKLNVSETDNALDLELVREVAPYFRLTDSRAATILTEVTGAVRGWRRVANKLGLSKAAQARMAPAFAVVER